MKVLATVASAALALIALAPASEAASFNCRSSHLNYTERTVCDNPRLSRLDNVMASNYFSVLRPLRGAERRDFQGAQVLWLSARNGCGAGVSCLAQTYGYRIDDLRAYNVAP